MDIRKGEFKGYTYSFYDYGSTGKRKEHTGTVEIIVPTEHTEILRLQLEKEYGGIWICGHIHTKDYNDTLSQILIPIDEKFIQVERVILLVEEIIESVRK